MQREKTEAAILKAAAAWDRAPAHVRIMAAAYVSPLLVALVEINHELEQLKQDLIKGVL